MHSKSQICHLRRYSAQTSKQQDRQRAELKWRKTFSLDHVSLDHLTSGEYVGSPAEVALQMSLNAGVQLVHPDLKNGTFAELQMQADVNSDKRFGRLLVDDPNHGQNARLWIQLLEFRQRIDGFRGVVDVWQGMRRRNIDLPVTGPEADVLWTTFSHAGIFTSPREERHSYPLLCEVFAYAQELKSRSGKQYPKLYERIVGRWFRIRPKEEATSWHFILCDAGLAEQRMVGTVAADAMASWRPDRAFNDFTYLYKVSEARDLYDMCLKEAIKLDDDVVALRWHRLFIQHGDAPSQEFFHTPGVQRLFELDGDDSLPMIKPSRNRNDQPQHSRIATTDAKYPPITRESMNTIVGDVHGIKPKEMSDNFCARMFATRAFSIDLVVKGLSFFGIEKLGPLAIREMAVRAGSPLEFSNKLALLKSHGMTADDSVFSRLVVKLADEGGSVLWSALMASDQHPETYEDNYAQEALLTSFLDQQELPKAHLSLFALSLNGKQTSARAWNRVLQHHISRQDWQAMSSAMRNIQTQSIPLTLRTLNFMFTHLLPLRRVARRPLKGQGPAKSFDPLDFVTNTYIYAAEKGNDVPSRYWIEMLKRHGMDHKWQGLEQLVLWLINQFSRTRQPYLYLDRKRLAFDPPSLSNIFEWNTQKALFMWGFRSAVVRHQLRPPTTESEEGKAVSCELWAQGLALLKKMEQSGFEVHVAGLRKAFQQRMWILFGPGFSVLPINREARQANQLSLAHYVRHANEIWPGLVDWVDTSLLGDEPRSDPKLLIQFFGEIYKTDRSRFEYANVGAWAYTLASPSSAHVYEPFQIPQRQRAWKASPLRLVRANPRKRRQEHRVQDASAELSQLATSTR